MGQVVHEFFNKCYFIKFIVPPFPLPQKDNSPGAFIGSAGFIAVRLSTQF